MESAYEYYDFITYIADRDSPGCADGVKGTLMSLIHEMKALDEDPNSQVQLSEIAKEFGVCPKTIPSYIKTAESLAQKFAVKAAGRYSNTNMDYYPPGPDTLFIQDCKEFQNATATPRERMRNFLIGAAKTDQESDCYDLGGGKNPAKDDDSGRMWDILCCYLAPVMGQSEKSMFPYQEFDPEGDIKDCKKEFGITMDPSHMVRDFKFSYDYLKKQSNILLTNGLNDGWGALSYHEDLSDKVVVLNFENGAHHSELLHIWTPEDNQDTPDILQGHDDIIAILGQWLDEIKAKKAHV